MTRTDTNKNDFVLIMGGNAQCRLAPVELVEGIGAPLSPAPAVASAIRRLMERPANGQAYHLTVADSVAPHAQVEALRRRGHRIEWCSYDEWRKTLDDLRWRRTPNSLHPILGWFPEDPSLIVFTELPSTRNTKPANTWPRSAATFERFLDFLEAKAFGAPWRPASAPERVPGPWLSPGESDERQFIVG